MPKGPGCGRIDKTIRFPPSISLFSPGNTVIQRGARGRCKADTPPTRTHIEPGLTACITSVPQSTEADTQKDLWTYGSGWMCDTVAGFFKKIFYLFIFREKGREGEREREKHQCVAASRAPPTGDLACTPTGNRTSDSLVLRTALNPRATPARATIAVLTAQPVLIFLCHEWNIKEWLGKPGIAWTAGSRKKTLVFVIAMSLCIGIARGSSRKH